MRARVRLPMYVVAAALLGLIAVLATLQYQWLGRISQDERERRQAALNAQAKAFAQDFDRELTRAYLLFQWEPTQEIENLAARVAGRYERWQATARYPRLVRDVYVVRADRADETGLQKFNPADLTLEPVAWPEALSELRTTTATLASPEPPPGGATVVRVPASLWERIPALLVPLPMVMFHPRAEGAEFRLASTMSHAVIVLDRDYIAGEVLPSLAEQHFRGMADGADYQLAVVSSQSHDVVYRSTDRFSPAGDDRPDASSDFFQVRPQEFGGMASEIRRISTIVTSQPVGTQSRQLVVQGMSAEGAAGPSQVRMEFRANAPLAVVLPPGATVQERSAAMAGAASAIASRALGTSTPKWRLVVQHRSGSLEASVDATRRRNLAISSGILTLLGVSVGFLVVSTRRAQQLATQQMEFVAAVSHELRTPLAVIRSAGDNLAEGVVADQRQVRAYGELLRNEGRRLTEMVEQILECAGIQSGQHAFVLRPVAVRPLLEDVVAASRALIDEAGLRVDYDLPASLPPALADEPALRRVFQNLIGNAIKYGAGGGSIRLAAGTNGRDVQISVVDAGIGIALAEQERIFEPFYRAPDAIAAQIQGAGLGLSLVKRIVEAHGGRITVRSAPGAGSQFTVSLPSATDEPVARQAPSGAHHAPGTAGHGSRA